MSMTDGAAFTRLLYSRVPANYRYYDREQGYPLLAMLRVIGEQGANLRRDLDVLWENYFIETCDDWCVPYIGALVSAVPLVYSMPRIDRLNVWNTVRWRRGKGTLTVLREVANAISGWPTEVNEFAPRIGWSQQVNHLRQASVFTPSLRDPYLLSLLGEARDPFAHSADMRAVHSLDAARSSAGALGIGQAAWGTPGRYGLTNVGVFVRRLRTFPLAGVTPAATPPGELLPADPPYFTFDPLYRDTPLFVGASGAPLTRAAFEHAPGKMFGTAVAVRRYGVLLASDATPPGQDRPTASRTPFTFGDERRKRRLNPTQGLHLLETRPFDRSEGHFIIAAEWHHGGRPRHLGSLSTLYAARGESDAYVHGYGSFLSAKGQLAITIALGQASNGRPGLPASPPARFPGAILAIRAQRDGAWQVDDVLLIYLPAVFIAPHVPRTYFVADDGSTYTAPDLTGELARASEDHITIEGKAAGRRRALTYQSYPARVGASSTVPVRDFAALNRRFRRGMRMITPERYGSSTHRAKVLIRAETYLLPIPSRPVPPTDPVLLGALATYDIDRDSQPELSIQKPILPSFCYVPAKDQVAAQDHTVQVVSAASDGLLSLVIIPAAGGAAFVPASEVVLISRTGRSLLVYLPEMHDLDAAGRRLFVADDGSTYGGSDGDVPRIIDQDSLIGLALIRPSAGQVLPMRGVWPLRQRQPVALDLSRWSTLTNDRKRTVLRYGEMAIDPEIGRFALAPDDPEWRPLPASDPARWADRRRAFTHSLSVDYVEAFSDRVGAHGVNGAVEHPPKAPTHLVSRSGDGQSCYNSKIAHDHIHYTIQDALANAVVNCEEDVVIEIVDSATYAPAVQHLEVHEEGIDLRAHFEIREVGDTVTIMDWVSAVVSSADYQVASQQPMVIPPSIRTLTIRANEGQRPCLSFYDAGTQPLAATLSITHSMKALLLDGLLISGGPLQVTDVVAAVTLACCTLDPQPHGAQAGDGSLSVDVRGSGTAAVGYSVLRCITGGLRVADSTVYLTIADSIVDHQRGEAIAGHQGPAGPVSMERVTVLGTIHCQTLNASDCLLDTVTRVIDDTKGYIRYSRVEPGSVLPTTFRCIPTAGHHHQGRPYIRVVAPVFNSRVFGRPDYLQLAARSAPEIVTASSVGGEVGAFGGAQTTERLQNLTAKLHEYAPAGLTAVIIADT